MFKFKNCSKEQGSAYETCSQFHILCPTEHNHTALQLALGELTKGHLSCRVTALVAQSVPCGLSSDTGSNLLGFFISLLGILRVSSHVTQSKFYSYRSSFGGCYPHIHKVFIQLSSGVTLGLH